MRSLRRLGRNKRAIFGGIILVLMVFTAVGAPVLSPHDPLEQDLRQRLLPPAFMPGGTWEHPLGTDALGRDLLSRLLYGSRISLLVGFVVVVIAGTVGGAVGLIAGYSGGWFDMALMRIADIQLTVPVLVLAITLAAILGPSLRNVVLVLFLATWVLYARVVRGEVLSLREQGFVEAARALGQSHYRIITRHLLPNVIPSVLVIGSLQVGQMINMEAALSFLGLGVPAEIPTWGGVAATGRNYIDSAWWVSTIAGIVIWCTAMGLNFLGDWLRDELDPRLRSR